MDKIKKTSILNQHGINILYLWEDDINNCPEMCKELILNYIKNNGAIDNYHSLNYVFKDGVLSLNENIISPYMDWNAENINTIVDLSLKEKMCKKQIDKWITFECEVCGNPKEELISHYNKKKHHYCSNKCRSYACTNEYKNSKKAIEILEEVC